MSNYRNEMGVNTVAAAMKALSNPTRLRIFLRLVKCCGAGVNCSEPELGACVSDLGKGLDIAPSTLSHHIKELRHAGLLLQERNGKELFCCVNEEALRDMAAFINGMENILDGEPEQKQQALNDAGAF